MKWLGTVWEQVYGLVVEDGWIALGAVGALLVTWLFAIMTAEQEAEHNLAGPLLFGLIMALVGGNLYTAGRRAARRLARGDADPG